MTSRKGNLQCLLKTPMYLPFNSAIPLIETTPKRHWKEKQNGICARHGCLMCDSKILETTQISTHRLTKTNFIKHDACYPKKSQDRPLSTDMKRSPDTLLSEKKIKVQKYILFNPLSLHVQFMNRYVLCTTVYIIHFNSFIEI